jgi:hypothetical protein
MASSNKDVIGRLLEVVADFVALDIIACSGNKGNLQIVEHYIDSMQIEDELRDAVCKKLGIQIPD